MSRIAAQAPSRAKGKAKELLAEIEGQFGSVPNLFRTVARAPAALEGLVGLSKALTVGALDEKLKSQISITVAERNGCDYCLSAHTMLGKRTGLSDADLHHARTATAVDGQTEVALRFVTRVIDQSGKVSDADLHALRAAGFSGGDIVEIVAQVALTNFTNLINNVALTKLDFPQVRPSARHTS